MKNLILGAVVLLIVGIIKQPVVLAEREVIRIYGRVALDRGQLTWPREPYLNPLPLTDATVKVFDRDPAIPEGETQLLAEAITDILGCYSSKIVWDTDVSGPIPAFLMVDARVNPNRMIFLARQRLYLVDGVSEYEVNFPGESLVFLGSADVVTIYGRVVDASLRPVSGARVSLYALNNPDSGLIWTTQTRDDGSFNINANWSYIELYPFGRDPSDHNHIADIELRVSKRTSDRTYSGSTTLHLESLYDGESAEYHYNTAEYMAFIRVTTSYRRGPRR